MITIATWNVNSIKVRLEQILKWSMEAKPDILAIQETKSTDENFPSTAIYDVGYQVVYSGQKTYNGVAILSKFAINDVMMNIPGLIDEQRRTLVATINDIRIINLYVPNGQSVDSDKYQYKLQWLEKVTNFIRAQMIKYPKLVVLGDFNIAPEDRDVHDPKAWEGKVLFTEKERQAFTDLLNLNLKDGFRLFEQEPKSYTWWDYRLLAFRRNHGLRIDHILLSDHLAKACEQVTIDKTPRKWQRPSDHVPVIAKIRTKN